MKLSLKQISASFIISKTKKSIGASVTTILVANLALIFLTNNKTELSSQSNATNELVVNPVSIRNLYNRDTGRSVCIIGTVHTSPESVQLTKRVIRTIQPNTVVLELDRKRIGYSLSTRFRNTKEIASNLSTTTTTNTSLVNQRKLIRQPVVDVSVTKSRAKALDSLGKPLSHVFRSLSSVGFTSDSEFKAAVREAFHVGAIIKGGDRDIDVTLRRLAEAVKATDSDKFAAMVVGISRLLNEHSSNHQEQNNSANGIRLIADSSLAQSQQESLADHHSSISLDRALADPVFVREMVEVMRREAPAIHQALIAERDLHLADCVLQSSEPRTVLVVGLLHVAGVERHLRETGGYCEADEV